MSYTDIFGGETIYPAGQSYLSLTFSVDQQLQWPIEQAVGGNVVSSIMDLDATAPGLNVDIPDARQVSNGVQSVFNNVGGNPITIRDALGGTILSIVPGSAWVAYLTDNSTEDGTWRIFQLGASVSVAVASALAGAGLKAIGLTLNQRMAPTSTAATPVTWTDSNRAQLTIWTGGLGVLNLPLVGVVGSDWFAMVRNGGSGDLALTPAAGTIDDAVTLILAPGQSATVVTDGVNWFTVGLGQSTAGFFDFVEINVAGSGDFTLSGVQLNRISYRFIGALTGNRNIIVPNTIQQYWVDNETTGAFSLFVKTVAQVTPVQIAQGARNITYCDSTDVLLAESNTIGFPVSIAQGGTGAVTAPNALLNLGAAASARLLNTLALSGLSGGGDLSADRSFALDVSNLFVELTIDPVADTLAVYDDSAGITVQTPIGIVFPGLLIQEEGVPLVTAASTLNFIGGAVTAAGAGATKTITIPIDAPTTSNGVLRASGSAWVVPPNISIDSIGRLTTSQTTFHDAGVQWRDGGGNNMQVSIFAGNVTFGALAGAIGYYNFNESIRTQESFYFINGGGPQPNIGTYLQLYNTAGHLVYQNDVGLALPICEEGSFVIDFDVGFTGPNTVTIQYIRIGNLVHITMPIANFGNSNANTLGTGADWPVGLRPASTRYGSGPCIDNAASIVLAQCTLSSAGTLSFFAPNAATPPDYGNFWTTSGVKGVGAGWSMSYRITDS
ncbi:MAG TPA: hypothetical protein VMW50_05955 [Dehalococcoidia bacterium]|nr:hypothetical protein [Dehalococcoidia bacterium]